MTVRVKKIIIGTGYQCWIAYASPRYGTDVRVNFAIDQDKTTAIRKLLMAGYAENATDLVDDDEEERNNEQLAKAKAAKKAETLIAKGTTNAA